MFPRVLSQPTIRKRKEKQASRMLVYLLRLGQWRTALLTEDLNDSDAINHRGNYSNADAAGHYNPLSRLPYTIKCVMNHSLSTVTPLVQFQIPYVKQNGLATCPETRISSSLLITVEEDSRDFRRSLALKHRQLFYHVYGTSNQKDTPKSMTPSGTLRSFVRMGNSGDPEALL